MAQVIWSPRAEKRLDEIGDYIAKDAPARAADFVERLLGSTRRLKEFPESGAVAPENNAFRQVVLQGYRLIYRIRGEVCQVVTIISPGQSFDLERQRAVETTLKEEWMSPSDDKACRLQQDDEDS